MPSFTISLIVTAKAKEARLLFNYDKSSLGQISHRKDSPFSASSVIFSIIVLALSCNLFGVLENTM